MTTLLDFAKEMITPEYQDKIESQFGTFGLIFEVESPYEIGLAFYQQTNEISPWETLEEPEYFDITVNKIRHKDDGTWSTYNRSIRVWVKEFRVEN